MPKTVKDLNSLINDIFKSPDSDPVNSCYLNIFSLPFQKPMYELAKNKFRINEHESIAGFKASELTSLDHYYDIMLAQDRDFVIDYSMNLVSYMGKVKFNSIDALMNEISSVVFRMKGNGGKIYTYRRISILNGISKSKISSNVSYLEDVSWLGIKDTRKWKTQGSSLIGFDYRIPELNLLHNMLSAREMQIVKLLARGFSSIDIGKGLYISRHTVDTHRRNMLHKLEVANTPELLLLAKDLGLV